MFQNIIDWVTQMFPMPHGHCYLWRPDVLWTNVISDASLVISYGLVPVVLLMVAARKTELPKYFRTLLWVYAAVFALCGATHAVSALTVWFGLYAFAGLIKATCAIVSLLGICMLLPVLPKILALQSPEQALKEKREAERLQLLLRASEAEARRANNALQKYILDNLGDRMSEDIEK